MYNKQIIEHRSTKAKILIQNSKLTHNKKLKTYIKPKRIMKINHRNQNQLNQKSNIKHQNQSSNIKI